MVNRFEAFEKFDPDMLSEDDQEAAEEFARQQIEQAIGEAFLERESLLQWERRQQLELADHGDGENPW